MARTDAGGISGRTAPSLGTIKNAKFSKIKTVVSASFFATGSERGVSGFIIKSAGNVVITPEVGDSIQATSLTSGTLYEIGVHQITGSGIVHLLY